MKHLILQATAAVAVLATGFVDRLWPSAITGAITTAAAAYGSLLAISSCGVLLVLKLGVPCVSTINIAIRHTAKKSKNEMYIHSFVMNINTMIVLSGVVNGQMFLVAFYAVHMLGEYAINDAARAYLKAFKINQEARTAEKL